MNGDFHAIYVNDYLFYVRKWRRIMAITESHYEVELTPRHIHDFVYNIEYNEINPNSIFVKR